MPSAAERTMECIPLSWSPGQPLQAHLAQPEGKSPAGVGGIALYNLFSVKQGAQFS